MKTYFLENEVSPVFQKSVLVDLDRDEAAPVVPLHRYEGTAVGTPVGKGLPLQF